MFPSTTRKAINVAQTAMRLYLALVEVSQNVLHFTHQAKTHSLLHPKNVYPKRPHKHDIRSANWTSGRSTKIRTPSLVKRRAQCGRIHKLEDIACNARTQSLQHACHWTTTREPGIYNLELRRQPASKKSLSKLRNRATRRSAETYRPKGLRDTTAWTLHWPYTPREERRAAEHPVWHFAPRAHPLHGRAHESRRPQIRVAEKLPGAQSLQQCIEMLLHKG